MAIVSESDNFIFDIKAEIYEKMTKGSVNHFTRQFF